MMLIQKLVGAAGAQIVQRAFGFGSAKSRPIGVSLFCRLFAFAAFLESFQINKVPHVSLLIRQGKYGRRLRKGIWRVGRYIVHSSSKEIPVVGL